MCKFHTFSDNTEFAIRDHSILYGTKKSWEMKLQEIESIYKTTACFK